MRFLERMTKTTRRTAGMRRRKGRKAKMGDYIKREPAILAVNMAMDRFPYAKDPKRPETYSEYNEGWTGACDYILSMIEAENTADVAPVVHGRWESHLLPMAWKCSVCGQRMGYNAWKYKYMNYCPMCGAKMDLDNEKS